MWTGLKTDKGPLPTSFSQFSPGQAELLDKWGPVRSSVTAQEGKKPGPDWTFKHYLWGGSGCYMSGLGTRGRQGKMGANDQWHLAPCTTIVSNCSGSKYRVQVHMNDRKQGPRGWEGCHTQAPPLLLQAAACRVWGGSMCEHGGWGTITRHPSEMRGVSLLKLVVIITYPPHLGADLIVHSITKKRVNLKYLLYLTIIVINRH